MWYRPPIPCRDGQWPSPWAGKGISYVRWRAQKYRAADLKTSTPLFSIACAPVLHWLCALLAATMPTFFCSHNPVFRYNACPSVPSTAGFRHFRHRARNNNCYGKAPTTHIDAKGWSLGVRVRRALWADRYHAPSTFFLSHSNSICKRPILR
jgi:hypothetical protein